MAERVVAAGQALGSGLRSGGETGPAGGSEELKRGAVKKLRAPKKASECREYLRRRLVNEFESIAEGFVNEAKAGSVAHVKLASELLSTPEKTVRQKRDEKTSVLDVLMRSGKAKRVQGWARKRGAGGLFVKTGGVDVAE
jgi:hypothetical protein